MDPKLSARVLVALSLAYGVTVGILGMFDSGSPSSHWCFSSCTCTA